MLSSTDGGSDELPPLRPRDVAGLLGKHEVHELSVLPLRAGPDGGPASGARLLLAGRGPIQARRALPRPLGALLMTRREAIPDRVSEAIEQRSQEGVWLILTGQIEATPDRRRAVSEYMRKCRESRVRMETAA